MSPRAIRYQQRQVRTDRAYRAWKRNYLKSKRTNRKLVFVQPVRLPWWLARFDTDPVARSVYYDLVESRLATLRAEEERAIQHQLDCQALAEGYGVDV